MSGRSKIARHLLSAAALLVAVSPLFAQTATPAVITYSATAIHQKPGQPETVGQVTKSGQKMRLEFSRNGQNIVQILRPSEGVMYILDPATQTFSEIRGDAVPVTADQGYTSPCPTPAIAVCDLIGEDTVSGIRVERWLLSEDPQKKPLVLLWDPTRRRALKQEFPDGSASVLAFVAMKDLNGRSTEYWAITQTTPDQDTQFGEYWFDPELRVVTRELLPTGEIRRLENIKVGPVSDAYFQVPVGWLPQISSPQAPVAAPRATQ